MSHIHTYKAKIFNLDVLENALQKLNVTMTTGYHTIKQYGRNTVSCIASFTLPGWKYPIGLTDEGELKYDHWGSEPNTMEALYDTVQNYWQLSIEETIDWSEVEGIETSKEENGDLKMTINFS